MKWIVYLVLFCAITDIVIIEYNINKKNDVFMPGFYVVLLLLVVIYSILAVRFIRKKKMMEKRIVFSIMILLPSLIFLFIHVLILFANIFVWIK